MLADSVGRTLPHAQSVEQSFRAPLQKALGGIQVIFCYFVIAA